jgi:NADPH:quinone reductase-like Zn-dependent oxidoreductase
VEPGTYARGQPGLENGEYRPVIDRSYPLEEAADASRHVETQQKTGNVVLTLT